MKKSEMNVQGGLEWIFIAISVATFQHTMWAAGFVFSGLPPQTFTDYWDHLASFHWWFNGALIAIAVDLGMFFTARMLGKKWNWILFFAFIAAALASYYTQVFYSVHHTTSYEFGSGVSDYWVTALLPLIDARVVIVPAILPGFAIIYTFASLTLETKHKQEVAVEEVVQAKTFVFNGKIYGPYETPEERDKAFNELNKKKEIRERRKERQRARQHPSTHDEGLTLVGPGPTYRSLKVSGE